MHWSEIPGRLPPQPIDPANYHWWQDWQAWAWLALWSTIAVPVAALAYELWRRLR